MPVLADGQGGHMNNKNIHKTPQKGSGSCESCEFYAEDEFDGSYYCSLSLDEDDRVDFLGLKRSCPYYRYYDEYKSVHKQI